MILSEEKYKNILAMLTSPDTENIVIGLNLIENIDFKDEFVQLSFLKKESDIDNSIWKKHAPIKSIQLNKYNQFVDLSYYNILNSMCLNGASADEFKFYIEKYSKHLENLYNHYLKGYNKNRSIELEIKIKINESGSTS